MAARKKSTSQAKKRTTTKSKGKQEREMNEQWSILMFGIGALLLAITYVPGASLWAWLRENVLFGIFGISTYLLAPILMYFAVLVALGKPVRSKIIKAVLLLLVVCGVTLVFSRMDMSQYNFNDGVIALHEQAIAHNGLTGGVLSLVFGWSMLLVCGRPAANIILVLLTVIGIMLFANITPGDIYYFCVDCAHRVQKWSEKQAEKQQAKQMERDERNAQRQQARAIATEPTTVAVQMNTADIIDEDAYARAAAHRRANVDIDLGPDTEQAGVSVMSPNEPVVIGPGGTFGLEALQKKKSSIQQGASTVQVQPTQPVQPVQTTQPVQYTEPEVRTPAETAVPDLDSLIRKATGPSTELVTESEQLSMVEEQKQEKGNYMYPPLSLFQKQKPADESNVQQELAHNAELLVKTLESFGVKTRILDISRGPSVTRYELQPLAGVKISRITGLADDIALNLAATGVRIEAPIPGKAAVGIEVPNHNGSAVNIRSILEGVSFTQTKSPVTMALGQDIAGKNWTWDLVKMPHVLIAGSTGSGKSVCINAIIMSFLYKSSPEDLRLIMIDPKMVELSDYNGIPHLLMPVVTEPRKAAGALGSAVAEMEKRYHLFAENGVRNIDAYNLMIAREGGEKMPYIAIIIDELADLMMVAGKEVEEYICRIAQKARAAGMHLIVATQRPSVDVITGLIKANIPSRIAFAVSSQIDSRTILDGAGAEKLLGKGDMLFMPVGAAKPTRIQGTYVQDDEIRNVQEFVKKHASASYDDAMIEEMEKRAAPEKGTGADAREDSSQDAMFDTCVEAVLEAGQASTSFLQRRCKLGYARAARIMDEMEQAGVVGPADGSKPRQILINRQQWIEQSLQQRDDADPNIYG